MDRFYYEKWSSMFLVWDRVIAREIARCGDRADAERIVAALNAAEAAK
jgi:hypothetical protein